MIPQEYKKHLNKKISEFSEDEKSHYNVLTQRSKRKKDKSIEENNLNIEKDKKIEEEKLHLYNQLFCLKEKFPDHTKDIHIDKDMSSTTLIQKKDLILKIITDKNSHNVVFEMILLGTRGVERIGSSFNCDYLDGLSETTTESKDDLIPVLKELIDTGQIDVSLLDAQTRLTIIGASIVMKTIEKNIDKKKNVIVSHVLEHGDDGATEK